MENVTIVEGRENTLEFDININGANKKTPVVRFVIEKNPIDYTFQCINEEDSTWIVTIPILTEFKKKAYPFRIEVIVDGYYFEPFHGTADIVAEPTVKTKEVHISAPVKPVVGNVSVKKENTHKKKPSKKKKTVKKSVEEHIDIINDEVESETIHTELDGFKDMADKWLNREKPIVTEKDKTVKNIIDDLKNHEVTCKPTVINTEENIQEKINNKPELSEKSIKVQAILKSFT